MTDEEIEKALKDRAYQISYADGDMNKGLLITPKDKLSQEALAYIERLKEACQSAVQSFTRMETLYKVKCTELECVAEKAKKDTAEEILQHILGYQSMWDDRGKQYNLYELSQTDLENIFDKYGIEVSND